MATRVAVGFPQLIRLWVHDRADGLPIFYGLPGLGPDDLPTPIPPEPFVQRAGWRLRPPFDGWQRMVRPLEVLTIGKVFDAFMRGQEGVTIDTALLQPFRSLGALIDDVLGCREGRQMPPDPRAPGWPLLRSLSDRSLSDIARRLKTDLRSPSELPERLDELLRLPEFSEETALATPEVSSATQMGRLMWLAIPIAGGR